MQVCLVVKLLTFFRSGKGLPLPSNFPQILKRVLTLFCVSLSENYLNIGSKINAWWVTMPSPFAQNICLYVDTAPDHILIEFRDQ